MIFENEIGRHTNRHRNGQAHVYRRNFADLPKYWSIIFEITTADVWDDKYEVKRDKLNQVECDEVIWSDQECNLKDSRENNIVSVEKSLL